MKLLLSLIDAVRWMSLSKKHLRERQMKHFANQMNHISHRIPYYKEYFSNEGVPVKSIDEITRLPIIEKEIVVNNLENFMTLGSNKESFRVSETSGSTGYMFRSYLDKETYSRRKIIAKLRSKFFNGLRLTDRIACLNSESKEFLREPNKKWIYRTPLLRLKYFSMLESPSFVLKEIVKFNPKVIYGPPSFILLLAEKCIQENVDLNFRLIFTSGELLTNNTRNYLEKTLNSQVYDTYGSSEFKEIAWECRNGCGYHINEDEVLVEILDENDQPTPNGPGSLVITDLRNKAVPLIRYRIADLAQFIDAPAKCKCNFKRIQIMGGRATDYVRLVSGEKISAYAIEDAVEKVEDIIQYQVIQHTFNHIEVKYKTYSSATDKIEYDIKNELFQHVPKNIKITCSCQEHIDVEENGKYKLVKSKLSD